MFIVILTWIYILVVSVILGIAFDKLWKNMTGYTMNSLEMYILTGLALMTVYAQIFSLFSKVGIEANAILLIACFALLIYSRREFMYFIKSINVSFLPLRLLVVLLVSVCVAIVTAQIPMHYDTYLYHAQAIRWVEEFGLVPGLGNLHNRFAYNSSFIVVQALLSFKFLYGASLHTLNGFVCVVFLLYAMFTFLKKRKVGISDGLRLVLIVYIIQGAQFVSSPNTDTFALILTVYILTKWIDFLEEGVLEIEPYGWLCLMGIYACTLKLSTAFIMVLLLKPVIFLIKHKQWKKMWYYVMCSLITVLPFVLRNVMISGYILYPYVSIDIIPFIDWKMNPAAIDYDRKEIIVWARGTFDVAATYQWSVFQWLPVWLKRMNAFNFCCFFISMASSAGLILTSVFYLKRREFDFVLFYMISVICLIGWLFSAPAVRYGVVYLWMPCVIFLFYWLGKCGTSHAVRIFVQLLCLCAVIYIGREGGHYFVGLAPYNFNLYDYAYVECVPAQWEGLTIYKPVVGDQAGYHYFPSTPYMHNMNGVELRGNALKDGFRRKP